MTTSCPPLLSVRVDAPNLSVYSTNASGQFTEHEPFIRSQVDVVDRIGCLPYVKGDIHPRRVIDKRRIVLIHGDTVGIASVGGIGSPW